MTWHSCANPVMKRLNSVGMNRCMSRSNRSSPLVISDRDRDGLGYELGVNAEAAFKKLMTRRGWYVEEAPIESNIYDHWDYQVFKDQWALKVDVKAQKRVSRGDTVTTPTWVWIEIKNNAGYPGWLYQTKADYLAFQRESVFYLVTPADLQEVVERLVMNELVEDASNAQYKLYSRKGRSDMLTMIRYTDLPTRTIVK